ncbi:hypothetical protein RF11_03958 [Thelohanellus kitauei]|uniref:Reverse transcriptase/retrotransposon-derived protein RNase H-like domain-containing protein n=1 Tax=Thelohanellus kitauei TaxID=669202 RepID=A0A0C2MFV0_THEKT|nr:hypothetical protein RF11_03958 [Thelohanellus kitauei]
MVNSSYGAKTSGSWRPCGDYRRLNVVANNPGSEIYSKVDLLRGHYHILVAKADIPKTANESQTFQRLVYSLRQKRPFVYIYLDDVQSIRNFPKPTYTKQLQRFSGMVNFYNRFVPHAAKLMQPLYRALKQTRELLSWTPAIDELFILVRCTAKALMTDASNTAIRALREQQIGGIWQPLAFFSKQLSQAEQKYSTFDR